MNPKFFFRLTSNSNSKIKFDNIISNMLQKEKKSKNSNYLVLSYCTFKYSWIFSDEAPIEYNFNGSRNPYNQLQNISTNNRTVSLLNIQFYNL